MKPVTVGDLTGRLKDLVPVLVACAVVLVGRAALADHYVVPTGSMKPLVSEGDRVIVNKLAYGARVPLTERWIVRWDNPRVGQVVVVNSPEDGRVLLKRVVAGPGDVVEVVDGRVTLNGRPGGYGGPVETLNGVAYPVDLSWGGGPRFGPARIPAGRYVLMGDNRGNSHDSRAFGLVRRDAILGRAVRIYFSSGVLTWRTL